MNNEIWCWCCRECGKDGPYSTGEAQYPKGWRFNLSHGLVCSNCAKKLNIKTSDFEKEVVDIKEEKPTWEAL